MLLYYYHLYNATIICIIIYNARYKQKQTTHKHNKYTKIYKYNTIIIIIKYNKHTI